MMLIHTVSGFMPVILPRVHRKSPPSRSLIDQGTDQIRAKAVVALYADESHGPSDVSRTFRHVGRLNDQAYYVWAVWQRGHRSTMSVCMTRTPSLGH